MHSVGNAELRYISFVMSYSSRFPNISWRDPVEHLRLRDNEPAVLAAEDEQRVARPDAEKSPRLLRNHDLAAFADPRRAKNMPALWPAQYVLPPGMRLHLEKNHTFHTNVTDVSITQFFPIARGLTEKSCESTGKIYDSLSIPCNFCAEGIQCLPYIHWNAGC